MRRSWRLCCLSLISLRFSSRTYHLRASRNGSTVVFILLYDGLVWTVLVLLYPREMVSCDASTLFRRLALLGARRGWPGPVLAGISDASASQLYISLINPTLFPSTVSIVVLTYFSIESTEPSACPRIALAFEFKWPKLSWGPLFTSDASGRSSGISEAEHPCSYSSIFRLYAKECRGFIQSSA